MKRSGFAWKIQTKMIFPLVIALASMSPAAPTTKPDLGMTVGKLAAGDDAFIRLIDRIMSYPVSSNQTLADVMAQSSEAELALRRAVHRAHKKGGGFVSPDGAVRVNAWITVKQLNDIIRSIFKQYPAQKDKVQPPVIPDDQPLIHVTGYFISDGRYYDRRPGWRHCDNKTVEATRKAAVFDFHQHLYDRIGRIPITEQRQIRHLFLLEPQFKKAVKNQIESFVFREPAFESIGICRVSIQLRPKDMISLLYRAARDSKEKINVDFSKIVKAVWPDVMVIDGLATAPPRISYPFKPKTPAARHPPPWVGQFITARAVGKLPRNSNDNVRHLLAVKAARIEARRQLWLDIERLALPNGQTIGELLQKNPSLSQMMARLDQHMIPVADPIYNPDGSVIVTLGLPLEGVWQILSEHYRDNP